MLRCPLCDCKDHVVLHEYVSPVSGEKLPDTIVASYFRILLKCSNCGLYSNRHKFEEELTAYYCSGYSSAAWGEKLHERYKKIRALPAEESNNVQRIKNLRKQFNQLGKEFAGTVLDVGTGTSVFGGAMSDEGWTVVVQDVAQVNVDHATQQLELRGICGDLLKIGTELEPSIKGQLNLICFNKVLEHVPVSLAIKMLQHASTLLASQGTIYIELPDGDKAFEVSPERQELYIEHYHAFTLSAFDCFAEKANCEVLWVQALEENTGKFTLRAILEPKLL